MKVQYLLGLTAFGILLYAFALLAVANRRAVLLLFFSWAVCWAPHLVIGIGFAAAGDLTGSAQRYETFAGTPAGTFILALDAFTLAAHWILSVTGFCLMLRRPYRLPAASAA